MKIIAIFLALYVALYPATTLAEEEANAPSERKAADNMCYQGICLRDSISKLDFQLSGKTNEANIRVSKDMLAKAKTLFPGSSKGDIAELAKLIYVIDEKTYKSTELIGIGGGMAKKISRQMFSALKRVKTICEIPDYSNFVWITVATSNGKNIGIAYSPMTESDGTSNYSVAYIRIPYPEIKSYEEMEALSKKAAEAMNVPLKCEIRGAGLDCKNDAKGQEFNIYDGIVIIKNDVWSYFDLNKARNHPLCKQEVAF